MTNKGENELIRMSKGMRESLGLETQSIISIGQSPKVIRLRVRPAFEEDMSKNDGNITAWVSNSNYDLLTVENNEVKVQSIQPFSGITLGADPECFLFNRETANLQVAMAAFRDYVKFGLINGLGVRVGEAGYAGWDGNKLLMEFRPDPVSHEEKDRLVENIRTLIKFCYNSFPKEFQLKARTYFKSIASGFHIHFGLPDVYITGKGIVGKSGSDLEELTHQIFQLDHQILGTLITNALNYYIGVPLILSDPDAPARVWNSSKYGRSKDAKRLHHYTLEYRIPGGLNLVHPEITKNLISAAHLVVANSVALLQELTDGYKKEEVRKVDALSSKFEEALGLKNLKQIDRIIDQEVKPSGLEIPAALETIGSYFSRLNGFSKDGLPFLKSLDSLDTFVMQREVGNDMYRHWLNQ
jgi:hypothetical protein